MRQARNGVVFNYDDGETEVHHSELLVDDVIEQVLRRDDERTLWNAINKLNEIQRRRIIKYYFVGKSLRKIADEESVDRRVIKDSIDLTKENLKNLWHRLRICPLPVHSSEGVHFNPDKISALHLNLRG